MSYEELRAVNNIIVGNPETVIKKLTEIIQHLNPGYLHIYGNEGPMPHKDVKRSIELLGKRSHPGPARAQAATLRVGRPASTSPSPAARAGLSALRFRHLPLGEGGVREGHRGGSNRSAMRRYHIRRGEETRL